MPQMCPMNWMFLLMFFTFLLIIYISLTYFIYLPKILFKKKNFFLKKTINNKSLNWKW
uniref:ATP synthase F0 subunit 8 n=1 Tax=Syrista parreyssii TaxID=1090889 RepID=A0A1W6Q5D5_9HYME|nr:ATP synthase F0 subunit 8 [Syrista parreyssii]UGN61579.1 ATP synthase F0 subunit 8 [Syrista parreyssii]